MSGLGEAMSGLGEIGKAVDRALKQSGYKIQGVVRLDRKYTDSLDFSQTEGFRCYMLFIKSLAHMMWWGIECVIWIGVA